MDIEKQYLLFYGNSRDLVGSFAMNRKDQRAGMRILLLAVLFVCLFTGTGYADDQAYSDRDLMVATQIAYYDFTQEQLDERGGSATVRELLNAGTTFRELKNKVNQADTELKKKMAEKNLELYEMIVSDGSRYGDWKVVGVQNTNQRTGFYSVLLETDQEHAIISFRGSESDDYNQVLMDWINADFGLLMARDTTQQKNAAEYMAEVNQKYPYAYYAVTGHSLGGNLAEHAVIAAPDDMRGKIRQAVSFDGPGYSGEYMIRNRELIEKVPYPITHYRWSLIGALLTQPSCAASRIIMVTEDIRSDMETEAMYMRHATPFIQWNGDSVQDGAEDLLSIAMGKWSVSVDETVMEKRRESSAGS